jgi:hypothetical protein
MPNKRSIGKYFYYYAILYIVQISWINLGTPPIALNYIFTILVLMPTFSNREYLPFVIALFGTTYEYYIGETFFIINVATTYAVLIIIWDFFRKVNYLSSMTNYILALILVVFCMVIELSVGNSISIATMPLYLRSIIWFYIFVFIINSKKSLEFTFIGFIVSTMVLITVYLFLNDGLTASKLTTDELNSIDFTSSKDRNYLSFNFSMTYTILLAIFFGNMKFESFKINNLVLLGLIGYTIIAVIAMSSRTIIIVLIIVTLLYFFNAIKSSIKTKDRKLKKNIFVLVLLIIGVLVFSAFNGYLTLLIYRIFEEGSLEDGSGRTDIVSVFFENFNKLSGLTKFVGQGYGSQYQITGGQDTHNDYLAILASYGYLGLLLWLIILFRMVEFKNISFSFAVLVSYLIAAIGISPMMVFSTPLFLASGLAYKAFYKLK